jgi:malonate decarboxylase beta subunit
MNGPEVIEQEAGADEIDSTDRQQIWELIGCEARLRDGFIDYMAEDTAASIAVELQKAFAQPLRSPQRVDGARRRLEALRKAYPQLARPEVASEPVFVEAVGNTYAERLSA